MRVLELITQAFINFFGITQPDEKARKRVSLYICGLLSLLLLIPCLILGILYFGLH